MKEEFISLLPEERTPEQKQLVQNLSRLYEVSQAMMSTIRLRDLLDIIMTAVTMGGGFGFNRAMLFLDNQKDQTLQGMIGVGPDTGDDAYRIWSDFSKKQIGLLEWAMRPRVHGVRQESRFDRVCKSTAVPLDSGGGVLARTYQEKCWFMMEHERADAFVWEHLFSKVGGGAFATVPVVASGNSIGVILVDNIYNRKPISDNDLKVLTIFASQAGMAIANSRLYQTLEEAHRELKETQEKLLQNEKLVALGELTASIAHEIRTPLVSIGGFARRLLRSFQVGTERKYAEIIVSEVSRLEGILNQILVFSREQHFDFEGNDLNKIIGESLLMFAAEFRARNIATLQMLEPTLPPVCCDFHQIKQVLLNLISNACQAMEEGGTITIRSQYDDKETMAVVEVEDTGKGIAPDIIGNIFNPFFTTRENGLGLGLSIVHKIVIHHRGTIRVRNNPDKGTTFILKLPVKES